MIISTILRGIRSKWLTQGPYTSGHSARVALYTDLIGESMGLPARRRRWLRNAALYYCMTWANSASVIAYSTKLASSISQVGRSKDACGLYRNHLIAHWRICGNLLGSRRRIMKSDGTGYRTWFEGRQELLWKTRIITADIFDAITAERPLIAGRRRFLRHLKLCQKTCTAIPIRCLML